VDGEDFGKLGMLVTGTALALFVPSSYWIPASRSIAAALATLRVGGREERERRIPETLLQLLDVSPDSAAAIFEANHLIESAQFMRHYLPWRWRPSVTLTGKEHLDTALAAGHGGVIWVANFASYNLVPKLALARHGYALAHLSARGHPHSNSRFGRALLNPVQTRVESRYLTNGRLLLDDGPGTLRSLYRLLSRNVFVLIAAGPQAGRMVSVPFLGGSLSLATGPARIAATSGAPLLPLFCLRLAADTYQVRVGEPLPVGPGRDFSLAARMYAEQLEAFVTQFPDQWQGWQVRVTSDTHQRAMETSTR
jgi:lauroyl/myristoyl acyltransferase